MPFPVVPVSRLQKAVGWADTLITLPSPPPSPRISGHP